MNAGNVENKGLEIELGWRNHIGDFRYGIKGNIATLKNNVTYIDPTLTRIAGGSAGQGTVCYFEKGHPIWYFRGYKYTGVDPQTGNPEFADLDGDGTIGDNDKTEIGSAVPDFTYGITIDAQYKGFDLIIFGSGSQGNDVFYGINRSTRLQANMLKKFYDGRWTTVGQSSNTFVLALTTLTNTTLAQRWYSMVLISKSNRYSWLYSAFCTNEESTIWVVCVSMPALTTISTITKYPGFDLKLQVQEVRWV